MVGVVGRALRAAAAAADDKDGVVSRRKKADAAAVAALGLAVSLVNGREGVRCLLEPNMMGWIRVG